MRQIRLVPIAALLLFFQTVAVAQEVATEAQLDTVVASYFKADEPGAAVVLPRARDQFFFSDSFTTMSFERGADGNVTPWS